MSPPSMLKRASTWTKTMDQNNERAAAAQKPSAVPSYPSESLFKHSKEIVIEHRNQQYRLRQTRNGKLILNL